MLGSYLLLSSPPSWNTSIFINLWSVFSVFSPLDSPYTLIHMWNINSSLAAISNCWNYTDSLNLSSSFKGNYFHHHKKKSVSVSVFLKCFVPFLSCSLWTWVGSSLPRLMQDRDKVLITSAQSHFPLAQSQIYSRSLIKVLLWIWFSQILSGKKLNLTQSMKCFSVYQVCKASVVKMSCWFDV